MKTKRRSAIKKIFASLVGITGVKFASGAKVNDTPVKEGFNVVNSQDLPLFSVSTRYGNMVFVSGQGSRLDGDIKVHTDNALKMIEAGLKNAGSSMDKVLKVTVFLENMKDFEAMNEVYRGRFGKNPPARTTVAVPNGLTPSDNLINIDCIAYI